MKDRPLGPKGYIPGTITNYPGAEDMARAEFWGEGIVYSLPNSKNLTPEEIEGHFLEYAAQRAWARENAQRLRSGLPALPFDPVFWWGRF